MSTEFKNKPCTFRIIIVESALNTKKMDVEILEVTNFPKELLGKQIIRDKETQETYINKSIYGKFANEYIQEKGLKYTQQDMFDFANWCIKMGYIWPRVDENDLIKWKNSKTEN